MIYPEPIIPAKVRIMNENDIRYVSIIEQKSYEFPWGHRAFKDCILSGYYCIVLERSLDIIGYAILSIAAREAHILNICIDKKFRNLGYGEQLLDELVAYSKSKELNDIYLEVRPSNIGAIELYQKKGFRQIADRPAYYRAHQGREDASVFSKRLKIDRG